MILHLLNKENFEDLCQIVAQYKGIPKGAVKLDYYIVLLLKNLSNSKYKEVVVFKGGTSLSKCYPNSIERFSEDIDLTYIPSLKDTQSQIEKNLKEIERIIIGSHQNEKIIEERNKKNKSSYVIFESGNSKIKLEIGSSVMPFPYATKKIKSYIYEYLEEANAIDVIEKYEFKEVEIQALDITRTFIDKIMAVKRHAICDNLKNKVRHIYDVVKLYQLDEIKKFLNEKEMIKNLIIEVKKTDSFYLDKRSKKNNFKNYKAQEDYNFNSWKDKFDLDVKKNYENLHRHILYTNEKQDFDIAIKTFEEISNILSSIGE